MDQELGLRERKKEKTRRLIAGTARRLFVERGFEAVPVAEIARAAEVSEATVFNYFPTKEDLVYWRLGSLEDELLTTTRDRQSGESALSAFRRFLLAQRGLLGQLDEASREQLVSITRVISESQALRARERGLGDYAPEGWLTSRFASSARRGAQTTYRRLRLRE